MLNNIIEKIKTDKVYQFGLILFVSVIGLKILVEHSAKKHAAAIQAEQMKVVGPGAALPANTAPTASAKDSGYSVTAARPARGTAAGIALMNRQATQQATRAVASASGSGRASWSLSQSGRAQPRVRQEVWRQTSGYAALPGKGTPVSSYAGQRQVATGSYHELKGSEMAQLEREIAGVKRPAPAVKKKIYRR